MPLFVRVIATVLAIAATASFAEPGTAPAPRDRAAAPPAAEPATAVRAAAGSDAETVSARPAARRAPGQGADISAYRGLATWVDVHDDDVYRRPTAAVAAMARRGVTTLFLETAHYNTPTAVHRPAAVARLIDAAHRRGMHVVAWYLPSFTDADRDFRRSMTAIRFTTPTGGRFDGFALDIEAALVSDIAKRNRRTVRLSRRIRAAVGSDYPLGAITPEADARYWPDFPYDRLARHYDVFLPMAYHSFRIDGPRDVAAYAQYNVDVIRRSTGDETMPVHMIAGIAEGSSAAEVRAFVTASRRRSAVGASLYDFATTSSAQWDELRRAALPPPR